MPTASWLADALLGSPIPPPRWLDPRHRGSGWVAPMAGYFSGPMHVPAGYSGAELDALASCVNPQVVQGWAWCLALVGTVTTMLGLFSMRQNGTGDPLAIAMVFAPIPAWFVFVLLGGFLSHDVELRDGNLHVRRWTDVWFDREGRLVGPRSTVHAVLSCGSHLHLAGDSNVAEVSMAMWPSSSRLMLEPRLEDWGIELEFPGAHHAHQPKHCNHGQHRLSHQIPEQGRQRDSFRPQ